MALIPANGKEMELYPAPDTASIFNIGVISAVMAVAYIVPVEG